ncbi:MAG: hypothetical protein NVS3B25_34110 [Hymenobacter sp.]
MKSSLNLPESPHVQALRDVAASLDRQRTRLTTLTLHQIGQPDITQQLGPVWQQLEGRQGVQIFHVPDPAGGDHLFLTVCAIAPNTEFTGSSHDVNLLIGLMKGDVECNGQQYKPGQFLFLPGGETASWRVRAGYLGCVLYDAVDPAAIAVPEAIVQIVPECTA